MCQKIGQFVLDLTLDMLDVATTLHWDFVVDLSTALRQDIINKIKNVKPHENIFMGGGPGGGGGGKCRKLS
jgi:hypothetical protein